MKYLMLKLIKNNIKAIIITLIAFINVLVLLNVNYKYPWKKMFGIECAGCGCTRILIAIMNLDFYQAFRFNPLLFILLVIGIIYFLYVLVCIIFEYKYLKINNSFWLVLMVIVILFAILRKIQLYLYHFLNL